MYKNKGKKEEIFHLRACLHVQEITRDVQCFTLIVCIMIYMGFQGMENDLGPTQLV